MCSTAVSYRAVPGTDRVYGATAEALRSPVSNRRIAFADESGIVLRGCYAMSGTDLAYADQPAMQCPVLGARRGEASEDRAGSSTLTIGRVGPYPYRSRRPIPLSAAIGLRGR
eukprot:378302-Rhodomonas_salina.6